MARRGNGEGSVRQRADGRWESRVRLPGGERVSVYGWTRAEVVEAAARVVRESQLGVSVADGRERYGDYLTRWLELVTVGKAESTQLCYESAVRLHITPVIGTVRLVDLSPYHIERVYATLLGQGLTDTAQVAKVLRQSLAVAERNGLVTRNVARLVPRPRVGGREEMQAFSPDEARQYLAGCDEWRDEARGGHRLAPLLSLLLWTGLRIGELMALRWRDVDLDAPDTLNGPHAPDPCLRVVATARYRWGDPIFRRAKTERSKRRVLLTPQAILALRRWREIQRADRLRAGTAWHTSLVAVREGHEGELINFEGLVCTDPIGRPVHQRVIERAHARMCRLSGTPAIRTHDLRHSFATLLLSAGVNPKVVSEMLGHTSVNLTLTLYSHVLPHMQTEAVARLSQLLGPLAPASPPVGLDGGMSIVDADLVSDADDPS